MFIYIDQFILPPTIRHIRVIIKGRHEELKIDQNECFNLFNNVRQTIGKRGKDMFPIKIGIKPWVQPDNYALQLVQYSNG